MKHTTAWLVAALLALSANAAFADGKELAQKNGCMSCHQEGRKVVGPSYKDVAKKYKGDAKAEDHLVESVKKGSKGVWGNVPMPPHPNLSEADAKTIIKWILSL
ncbi:MAG: c-type cytochrome [Thiobacillaceae bacterium]|nr:c-type cytochrome [Thiobacillaceae bacterium]